MQEPSLLDMFTRQPCSKIMRAGRTIKHCIEENTPVIGGRLPIALSVGFFLQRHLSLPAPFATDLGSLFKWEETMTAKLLALLSVLAVGCGLGTAFAQQAPTENKGVKTEPLSGFPLGKQGLDDFAQRQFRIRQITIEPGGVAAFHSHKERPALTYIMKGTLIEHRNGAPDRTYKAGEVLTETTDVDHWAENTSTEPAVVISADLFKE
jgi:quercetin dioxygenase-like cupin family protein